MTYQASEHDYKYLKKLTPIIHERICKKINIETLGILTNEKLTNIDKYNEISSQVNDTDKKVHELFHDIKRSTTFGKVYVLYKRNLLSEEEFLRFSEDTKELIKKMTKNV